MIREQDPLKQGLKLPVQTNFPRRSGCIREQDPLKQGLKLVMVTDEIMLGQRFVSKIH